MVVMLHFLGGFWRAESGVECSHLGLISLLFLWVIINLRILISHFEEQETVKLLGCSWSFRLLVPSVLPCLGLTPAFDSWSHRY